MPVNELLSTGLDLMLLGMGIVVTFLVMLVFVMNGVSRLVGWVEERHGIEPAPAVAGGAAAPAAPSTDHQLIAVISAAVARYRNTRR